MDARSIESTISFNPRPPRRGRSSVIPAAIASSRFQSAPPAKGAMAFAAADMHHALVSIRAPREGGDGDPPKRITVTNPVSIRAPREGGDAGPGTPPKWYSGFQSAPPAKGAIVLCEENTSYFGVSIRAPREGGDDLVSWSEARTVYVSIRAPREGGDRQAASRWQQYPPSFNPRPPRRGRWFLHSLKITFTLFQSAPPAKGAMRLMQGCSGSIQFQSAPPAKGAIKWTHAASRTQSVSIRAPREGGDECMSASQSRDECFNPRPPRRGRYGSGSVLGFDPLFQSAPPAKGAMFPE